MQFARLAVLAGGSVLAFTQAGFAAPTLIPMDEAVTTLASPASANPAIPAYQYNFSGNRVATLVTANPLLCGNTAAATGTNPTGITPVYYSANGSVGSSPKPFVFGAASGSPSTSAIAYGATNVVYKGNQMRFGGDPLDALVCYGLDANGVHKVTRDLFADDFETPGTSGILGNSTVALNVIQLPNAGNGNYYIYTIDIDIPPLPSGTNCTTLDCNFALVEGYDTSVFDTTSGQWCAAPAGATSCVSPPPSGGTAAAFGDININYSNYGVTVSLMAPIGGTQHKTVHFVAFRKLATGVTALPVSGAPVVMAALFSPLDLLENKLDDNVATGNNTLANVAPSVATDSTFTNAVAALQENSDSGALTFTVSDPDSPESTGSLLHASVTLNLPNGIQVPVAADCGSTTPITTLPVNRTCTIDIPLNNGAFWNSAVGVTYQNQFSNVATDTTNGTYASGVTASIQIVATDAQGKNSAPVSTPVHINSTKNDAPVITADANQLPSVQDPNDSNTYPTYSCSIAGSNCVSSGQTFNTVVMNNAVSALAGPAAAFDELAAQTTAANDLQCAADGSAVQVLFANAPVITAHSGSQTQYDIAFQFKTPLVVSSSLCTLTMTDAESGGFPNTESAATTQSTFRIVVNP